MNIWVLTVGGRPAAVMTAIRGREPERVGLAMAARRALQGRYDDAVARVYRALELIAHTRRRGLWEIDRSDVDPEKSAGGEAAPHRRARVGRAQDPALALSELGVARGRRSCRAMVPRESIARAALATAPESLDPRAGLSADRRPHLWRAGVVGLRLCREALARFRGRSSSVVGVVQLPARLKVIRRFTDTGR